MTRHYLDHASTTALRPEARDAVIAELDAVAADPGRIHAEAFRARHALEAARQQVATFLSARPREVVFTSGATESIATAIRGTAGRGRHIVVSTVEHSAVGRTVEQLAAVGSHEVTAVGCDARGIVAAEAVRDALRPDTALVCIQLANHEVGSIQPIADIAAICRAAGVLLFVDAAQACGRIPVAFGAMGVDLMAVSAHKLGGPVGIGALLVRRGLRIDPLLVGGDQERARRAGLENLPAAAGFAAACRVLADPGRLEAEARIAAAHTDEIRRLVAAVPGVRTFGPDDPAARLPHLVCLGIDGVEPQAVLIGLDHAGIACHSGSACATEAIEPSPVLRAMGVDAERSLRVSVGWSSVDDDVTALGRALPGIVSRLRQLAD